MPRTIITSGFCHRWLLIATLGLYASVGFSAEPAVKPSFVRDTLIPIAQLAPVVKAVRESNQIPLTPEQIQNTDSIWRQEIGLNSLMQTLLNNDCARMLRELADTNHLYREIFVMNKFGTNVCMSHKTSDYWQGDEAKFIESFNNGKGGVHIGPVEFDESAQAFLVQVSIPVYDGKTVIGAITFGLDAEEID
ncbi:MAG: PDC sensor domain-containing protein [Oleiphilaceae bacterium]|nr:PDC sensor domain-containing protein [Oleiphilaceae bacterium]